MLLLLLSNEVVVDFHSLVVGWQVLFIYFSPWFLYFCVIYGDILCHISFKLLHAWGV